LERTQLHALDGADAVDLESKPDAEPARPMGIANDDVRSIHANGSRSEITNSDVAMKRSSLNPRAETGHPAPEPCSPKRRLTRDVRQDGPMGRNLGPVLVVIGIVVVAFGLLAWSGALSWFGRLPGDIRVEREGMRLYVPWVSMLLISAVASLLLWVFRR